MTRGTNGDDHPGNEDGDIKARWHGGWDERGSGEGAIKAVTITQASILEIHKPQQTES